MTLRPGGFVGRRAELSELCRMLDTTTEGFGGAAFVIGEAGVGKSRLAREVERHAVGAGVPVLRGRGSSIGPLVPFRPLVEALLGVPRRGLLPAAGQFSPTGPVLGPYRPVLGRLIPDWAGDEAASDDSVVVLAEAVLRLLSVIGTDSGVLLVLDDLQDADPETLAVLEYLIDNVDSQATMLLGTFRSDVSAAFDLIGESARRNACQLVRLEPLLAQDVRELATIMLDAQEALPDELVELLWQSCAGNPFIAEEVLDGMVNDSLIALGPSGWQVIGERRPGVPSTVARSISRRTDQLGEQGRSLLSCAAVLGQRFPLSIVQRVTGLDDHSLLSHLRSGVAAQLVVSDTPAPDWYAFRHPLTVEALLAELTPRHLVELSTKAADAIEAVHPELPGQWCQLVASLRLQAGDTHRAARQLTTAGHRALVGGAPGSASALLQRAVGLLDPAREPDALADALEGLIPATAEIGAFDQGLGLDRVVEELAAAGLAPPRLATLHTALARVAYLAGRFEQGVDQVAAARRRLGDEPADEQTAPMETTAAYLALDLHPSYSGDVEELARRAVAAAERVPLPAVACEGWQFLGMLARERDIDEARECLHRAREIAEEHQLRIQRMYVLVRLGGIDWLCEGDSALLERVRQESLDAGSVTLSHSVDAILALHNVLRGEFAAATEAVDECLAAVTRLQAVAVIRYLLMVRAVLHGHQGRRREMEAAIAEFYRHGGAGSQEESLLIGLGQAFCALVEEDRPAARQELDRAAEREPENRSRFYLAGDHGVGLLLDVVDNRAGWPELDTVLLSPAAGFRWNRFFVGLARAVLLGRDGRAGEATAVLDAALADGAAYSLIIHLGLRWVVDEAHRHGWGDPIGWCRRAEDYFHQVSLPGPASACRQLLRDFGAPVRQRRSGIDRVPTELRGFGVTVREFEVFELVARGAGNKAIAGRLHISPRTVEKHVASLIGKTGHIDRSTLGEYAAGVLDHPEG
jgi:predicted ATPase/DNA-binding CsgD family transcriptional regulator